jgi:aspartate/methionine/tyrosine aminotransferase
MMPQPDQPDYFRLKPIRAARVSEVSETTAASPVPVAERINFHIGNPLQDARLSSAFMRIALGLDVRNEALEDSNPEAILDFLGWEAGDKPTLELLIRLIQRSAPYMPRGGYAVKSPGALVKAFTAWLEKQQEGLRYDSGEQTGRREIILASGGVEETLRVILFTLSAYLEHLPAQVLCYDCILSAPLRQIPGLNVVDLAHDEAQALAEIEAAFVDHPDAPVFLILGRVPEEAMRRRLRRLSVERPLFFIEANDAPNHRSLAREARLVERVIRLLTPGIFSPRLASLSTVFIAGNAGYLSAIENVHFNLKGTPCASDVALLEFLLEQHRAAPPPAPPALPTVAPAFEGLALGGAGDYALPDLARHTGDRLNALLDVRVARLEHVLGKLESRADQFAQRVQAVRQARVLDEFAALDMRELLDHLVAHIDDSATARALQRSFLSQFTRHQPQYDPDACLVTSGSSRTALAILGFHCGISEVVIPDLSWSYEQCFPVVHAVPLSPELELDADAVIARLEELRRADPAWIERGAVAINNPHNATGRVFDEGALRRLIAWCLEHGIWIIDDLAYQNVAPVPALPEIRTVRQITDDLIRAGEADADSADRVLSVHSMSKTDCLAGARMAVVEIREPALRAQYEAINSLIRPNLGAIFIGYLFYRGASEDLRSYWQLRNAIFAERTDALLSAVEHLPPDRNPFHLTILPPTGSMYPLLHVERLPAGLSLDWLSSSLARRGIGLLPLATFARTEKGYETGRTTFRLTLGGVDGADVLLGKTRRLLIDLNHLIVQEDARYNRRALTRHRPETDQARATELNAAMERVSRQIIAVSAHGKANRRLLALPPLDEEAVWRDFERRYAPERLAVFRRRLLDRALLTDELMREALGNGGKRLGERLQREFMKDTLERRYDLFRRRTHDRTVHPTQMYALGAEFTLDAVAHALTVGTPVSPALVERAAQELLKEYVGSSVPISSRSEADEILLDLAALTAGEQYAELFTDTRLTPFLSFWSDWDGSNRPSGQGHQLAAAVVMENVRRMAHILRLLRQIDPAIGVSPELVAELEQLGQRNQRFTQVLNNITALTHQLEQRYRGVLPFSVEGGPLQRFATRLHLRRDPARVLWQHNDRYEQRMLELRQERRRNLEHYFGLNKQLRKQLHALIPAIQAHRGVEPLLREVVGYQDILQRMVITPRIQQSLITARDSFALDTTVHNMHEINAIAGEFGNPGITLALQVSLSTQPDALIALDRKMRTQLEEARREKPALDLPSIWLIPLFEDAASVKNVRSYLDSIWEYAQQSRQTAQPPQARFAEMMAEVFFAGSDLSQQVSQAVGARMYQQAKYDVQAWLAEHGVAEEVRVKMGSGEPMQRQGAYYSRVAGMPAFMNSADSRMRFSQHLNEAARASTGYAVTPLQGVFLGADLRTFQSNISEQMRFLPVADFVGLLHHVRESQQRHRSDLIRAAEMAAESRLLSRSRSVQELERLTVGASEPIYEQFLVELTESFRHILYGREEDVLGLHIISYFIGRSIPQLRDRPTSRRTLGSGAELGQRILANIAEIIPLAKHGSLLRAISHNQAQTAVLGVNQLTTGLFRALDRFVQKSSSEQEYRRVLSERLLPHLPVYEILSTLRIYQDRDGAVLRHLEGAFPAGNSAFVALREDQEAMERYLPLFQQELLRRHGVNVHDFFRNGVFIPDLLPTLRPDLAVLLQRDLFNTDAGAMLEAVTGPVPEDWRAEVERLLSIPQQVGHWRAVLWGVLLDSTWQRVQSFAELALALSSRAFAGSLKSSTAGGRGARLPPALAEFFRTASPDDEMRGFLSSAIEYLNSVSDGNLEMPVIIIRAINEAERIAVIEETTLPPEKQKLVRHCILQISRLAGENG